MNIIKSLKKWFQPLFCKLGLHDIQMVSVGGQEGDEIWERRFDWSLTSMECQCGYVDPFITVSFHTLLKKGNESGKEKRLTRSFNSK